MKKITFTILSVLSLSCYAQDFNYGAKLGLNLSNVSGTEEKTDSKLGLHVGSFLEYSLNENSKLIGELSYNNLGVTLNEYSQNIKKLEFNFNYISFSFLYKYQFLSGLYAKSGLQYSYLTKVTVNALYKNGDELKTDFSDFDGFNKSDFAIPVGVGYQFTNGLFAELNYSYSFTNVIENYEVESNTNKVKKEQAKNNFLNLSIGYKF